MSPTSSRVIEPTDISIAAERDSGRITVSAPSRSSWVSFGALPSELARAAARKAASRTSAARSATTKPGVRSAISPSSRSSVGAGFQQALQQRDAGRRVGQAEHQFAVAQVRRAQSRVEVVRDRRGDDHRHPRGGDGLAQFGQDQRRDRFGRGRQQRVDVGDQQHSAAVAHCATPPRPPAAGGRRRPARRPRGCRARPVAGRRRPPAPAPSCRHRPGPTSRRPNWLWRPGFATGAVRRAQA